MQLSPTQLSLSPPAWYALLFVVELQLESVLKVFSNLDDSAMWEEIQKKKNQSVGLDRQFNK